MQVAWTQAGRIHTVCIVHEPILGGVGVSCLEIISLGSPVSLFSFTHSAGAVCQWHAIIGPTSCQAAQPADFFSTCLYMEYGETCFRKHSLRSKAKEQRAGRADWRDLVISATVSVVHQGHKYIQEHIQCSVFVLFLLAPLVWAGRGKKAPS